MKYSVHTVRHKASHTHRAGWRFYAMTAALFLSAIVLVLRFYQIQIVEHRTYALLARGQHEAQASLIPRRGTLYVRDSQDGALHPVAKDREAWLVYAVPRDMEQPVTVAERLAGVLSMPVDEVLSLFDPATSTYVVIARDVSWETIERLRQQKLSAIGYTKKLVRYYPETGLGGQVFGFVRSEDGKRSGHYGIEGFHDALLAGQRGEIITERDAFGRRLSIGTVHMQEARDGADVVLTLDRSLQYAACRKIREAIVQYDARGGSIVIMDPHSGAIRAMCSAPDFDPSNYGAISNVSVLNNPAVYSAFEPGSTFKPITMAAGLDAEKVTPHTGYLDTGEERIDEFVIRNSDKKAHGWQTMTQVLEESLNTGTIFVQRLLGRDTFQTYVRAFGFGEKTGIELQSEAKTTVAALDKQGEVFAATASFGQGVTVHALQMVAAYAALGNGGKLYQPYIVEEVHHADGRHVITQPRMLTQVITSRTSRLISAMLVNVVERGHGKRAGVKGYYVAGKTGTAQIPNPDGPGYLKDEAIGSFVGYAPADQPAFVMMVKLDRPRATAFAESSAAPVFGEMAQMILQHERIPPERPVR